MSDLPPPQSRESLGTTFKRLVRQLIFPSNARTGESRIVVGADTPPELQAYGVIVALLFYVTDVATGLEIGYFFIGQSNTMDIGNQKDLLFGNVAYPTPGDPSSPGMVDVKTNHQIELFHHPVIGQGYTIFKDSKIRVNSSVPALELFNALTFFQGGQTQFNGSDVFFQGDDVWFGNGVAHQVTMDDDTIFWLHGAIVTTSTASIEADGTLNQSFTLASNVLITNTSMNIVKKLTGTRMRVRVEGTAFLAAGAAIGTKFGVRINGVDYDVGRHFYNFAADHRHWGMTRTLPAIAAGSYTCQAYFRIDAIGRTVTINADDVFYMRWEEIY